MADVAASPGVNTSIYLDAVGQKLRVPTSALSFSASSGAAPLPVKLVVLNSKLACRPEPIQVLARRPTLRFETVEYHTAGVYLADFDHV